MILTLDPDPGFSDRVRAAVSSSPWIGEVVGAVAVPEVLTALRGAAPVRAVVLGPGLGVKHALEMASQAAAARPSPVVLLVCEPTAELLLAAMRSGVDDVLPLDFDDEDLLRSLREAGLAGDGATAQPGLTVAVFSSKGGVGTSVVAANLAVRVAVRCDAPTTLVDLDLASADLAIMHGLAPEWTVQDLADGSVGSDAGAIDRILREVPGSGARLLPGPMDPARAERIVGSDIARILAMMRASAPYVVVDTSSSFDDRTLAAIDAADVVVVVASLDVAALRGLTVSLRTLHELGVQQHAIRIVLNRADSKSGLTSADVERATGRTIDVEVPSTRAVARSINEGVPMALSARRSAVVAAIDELVESILTAAPDDAPVTQRPESSGGLFSRFRSDGEVPAATSASATERVAAVTSADPRKSHDDESRSVDEPTSVDEPRSVEESPAAVEATDGAEESVPTEATADVDLWSIPVASPVEGASNGGPADVPDEDRDRIRSWSLTDLPPPAVKSPDDEPDTTSRWRHRR